MAVAAVTCPRCKGEGEISVRLAPGEDPTDAPCPVCRGTGSASWSEPMGAPRKRASRGTP